MNALLTAFYAVVALAGALVFLLTRRTPRRAYIAFRRLYALTDGRSNDLAAAVLSRLRPPAPGARAAGVLGELDAARVAAVCAQLERDGFFVFEERLAPAACERLRRFALESAAEPMPAPIAPEPQQVVTIDLPPAPEVAPMVLAAVQPEPQPEPAPAVVADAEPAPPPDSLRWFETKWARRSQPLCRSGVWRFHELLPFAPPEQVVTVGEGQTPLVPTDGVGVYIGLNAGCLYLQYEGMNPSGSFKDNGMTAAFTHARTIGAKRAACASTGNTSASLALYCCATKLMQAVIFIGSGKNANMRPADIVGAIVNEAGIEAKSIGGIEVNEKFSLVELPEDLVDDVIQALRSTTIKGKKQTVRRDAANR